MKYLKTFEAINHQEIIDNFIDDYKYFLTWHTKYEEDMEYKMKDYKFPEEFKYEFSLLYFLYSQSSWRTDDKTENNRIKRTIKKYLGELIRKKLDDNLELHSKLQKMYDDKPKWHLPSSRYFGTISEANVKHIFTVFHTILSKHVDVLTKYNL